MSEINITKLGAHIKVMDINRSRRFYEALGFKKIFEYGPGTAVPEKYSGVTYGIGDSAVLEIADGHMAVKPEVFRTLINNSKMSLMITVESLVPVLEAAQAHGINRSTEPRYFPWNTIEFVLEDPDGARLVFIAPHSEEEEARVQRLTPVPLRRTEPNYAPR